MCRERKTESKGNTEDKEGLEVYGVLKEGIGFKDYPNGCRDIA